ncbi:MAG TPA: biotin/lipoyl-containing protein [Candidatus Limnocylindrales bacterium]|nr:biotin/lipoyl-containing protein [Candidatus Limnocylindrales bacterium]
MSRRRVTDRATGDHVADVDPAGASSAATPGPGSRPLVLPASTRPSVRGRIGVEVVVDGWRFEFDVEDADLSDLRARATAAREAGRHHGPTDVRAIIPGRVVSVAVAVGDDVEAGQRLLSVEAMKMENELRAPRAGTVERVAVGPGQTVELGDSLIVLR